MIPQFAPITLWLFLTLWISSCTVQEGKMPFLRVENLRFVDTQNREVILNGLNHVVKDPAQNYLYPDDEQLSKPSGNTVLTVSDMGLSGTDWNLSRVSSMKST